jgi:copper(I)-binding protein
MKHETKRLIAGAAVLASLIAPGLAAAQQLEIVDAWARATPTGVETAAAYLKIENIGDADRLVAARSPVSREVQIHDHVRNGLFMRMVRLDALELPAASVTEFAPGGRHLMFIGIAGPFIPGRAIELTLVFERSGERTVVVPVRDARSSRP